MAWIDYRKAYDMVPHSWIWECARMVGVVQNITTFIDNSMANWKTVLTSNQEVLWTVENKRKNLSRRLNITIAVCDHHDTTVTDSKGHKSWLPTQERGIQDQSPALYWLSLILRDTRAGYQLKKERYKINHLLLKIYGKNSSQIDSLVQTVSSYSEDIGMKLGIDKCAVLELERGG